MIDDESGYLDPLTCTGVPRSLAGISYTGAYGLSFLVGGLPPSELVTQMPDHAQD